ncbi:AraC family transcriptional regulator [Pedobacter cryoconitis]|uniref:YesN/AraC family two-component response regulator n=1 Tax=Pedobacter cryoconitis TaxID=188932 RepID=A0A7X0IZ48_9SPHI|nr:AraC family transcriptional regulator [Pedobacter cryoconitis]MBB6498028.1 YesN/AraC family two-component response regulator [Pedobacter cryoconitis]
MKSKHLHKPFDIFVSDMEHWNERPLIYQFFEIVQIMDGEGIRIVNENKFPYSKGSIFLFTPLDCRGFESRTNTRYCSIRFSEVFLEQYKTKQEKEKVIQWLKQLETIFTYHNRFEQVLIKESRDCDMITALIENMLVEYDNKPSYYDENLQHLVVLILNIISRNVNPQQITAHAKMDEPLINKMLVYLHQHIHCPKNLRIKHLAEQFNLSANYIGEYFKNLTGDSLHCYLTQYKMNIVEQRLIYSEHTIGQIADDLGFSDESHLSRQFKKHKGITAVAYRKQFKQ